MTANHQERGHKVINQNKAKMVMDGVGGCFTVEWVDFEIKLKWQWMVWVDGSVG